ncbi:MAG TPA: YebC/PmpR family DNA-binding transcriptional regulator [Candidatus Anammoximicrobium sp.]|nr:YebC/PmpR family DNA-binding transcriptional regulator [Candidatus Anammoximicrobium sp.]
MAGHSHWAGIKHKKALIDNKRGKLWSKLSKAIIVAAKMGGGDQSMNIRLRTAVMDAKAVSMPKDNIERAIKKGTGELDGGNVEETVYEGYGPAGVAVMCDIVTDNRNRTAPELRKLFEIHGGKLGGANCVGWMFERKGLFTFAADTVDEEKLMEVALDVGADDVKQAGNKFEVTCPAESYTQVLDALTAAGLQPESSELTRIPTTTVDLNAEDARKVLKLMEALDDHDDVQNVSANFNIPDDVMAELSET